VTLAGLATVIAGGLSLLEVIAAFGKAFITSRYVAIVWLVLPVIGLLEHAGLKERARAVVGGLRAATSSRVLLVYFAIRQITAALGLTSLGGHAQMVRPLIAPMAEGAAENEYGELPQRTRYRIRANAAAVDNTAFWGVYAVTFLAGSHLPDLANGLLVIAMVLVASIRGLGQGKHEGDTRAEREASARRWGNRLFIPALAIPLITVLGTVIFKRIT